MAYEVGVAGVTSTRTLRTAMTNYRSKRGNCYYFRRKIPLELQAQFCGRKEIVKALGTSDFFIGHLSRTAETLAGYGYVRGVQHVRAISETMY
jgi:hypothetical protein